MSTKQRAAKPCFTTDKNKNKFIKQKTYPRQLQTLSKSKIAFRSV